MHSGFLPQFLFRFETSSVHFISRESDISHETIDDLASKLIIYGKESKEKDQFYGKSSIGPCEISVSRLIKWTFDVSKRYKNCGKNPLCILLINH